MTRLTHTCTCGCAPGTTRTPPIEQQTALWAAYCEARKKADASGNMDDGREAGKAWGRFLNLFLAEDGMHVH